MRATWLYGLLVLALALVASRTTFTHDLADLVPRDGPLPAALALLSDYQVADVLLVEVDGSGVAQAELLAAVDRIGAALAADPLFPTVRYRVGVEDGVAIQTALAPVATALIPAGVLAERVSPAGMAAALDAQLIKLSGPASALYAETLRHDPLDLWGLATDHVRSAPGPFRVQVSAAHFLDETGTHAVLFVQPGTAALVADPSGALLRQLEAHLGLTDLPTRYLGGHRIASESAAMIHRDLHRGGALGIACLVGVFLLGFRSLRPVGGAVVPLLLAIAAGGAACAVLAPVHAITLGFVAPLLGLAVDYWIHLYVDAAQGDRGASLADRLAAARAARSRLLPAYALGAGSTSVAFAALTTSSYPVIADLGWLGLAALAGALGGTLLLGPAAAAWLGTRPFPAGVAWRPSRRTRLAVAGVLVAAALAAPQGIFDGDPRALNGLTPETAAVEAAFDARYGGFGTGGMAVVAADSLGGALDGAAAVQAALATVPGVTSSGPLALLPGPTAVARRLAALPSDEQLRRDLETVATAAGFAPGATADALLPRPDSVPLDTWQGTPVQELIDRHVRVTDTGVEVMLALVFDELTADQVVATVTDAAPSARLLVPAHLAQQGVVAIRAELLRLGGLALLAITALLGVRYRAPRPVIAALAPALAALVFTAGAMAVLGQAWTAVSTCAMVLILGLGLDYGVFMVEARRHGHIASTRRGVLLSAATTIAGFGTLVTADSPALHGVGLACFLGVGAAGVLALTWLSPEADAGPCRRKPDLA